MENPCILISSCNRDVSNGFNQAIRDTWGLDCPFPYFFILGDGNKQTRQDEVVLNVPDHYLGLTYKTKESLAWSVRMGFTTVFRAFTDTFIDTQRLKGEGLDHVYTGNRCQGTLHQPSDFAHGGPGYWLGRRAIKILLDSPIALSRIDADKYEDQWVGRILAGNGIFCKDDKNYSMAWSYGMDEPYPLENNGVISAHLSNQPGQYDGEWMHQVYAKRFGLPFKVTKPRLKGCACWHCQRAAKDNWPTQP